MKIKLFILSIILKSIFIVPQYVADDSESSFQEYLIAQPTPVVQLQFTYDLLPDYTQTSISGLSTTGGSVTQGTGMAFLTTNGVAGARAVLASKARINYQSGQGVSVIFSVVFGPGTVNNTQYVGVGNAQDGFFFGYNGTTFGILHRNNFVDTWINQSSWNGDVLDGLGASQVTLNPLFGNVYKIQYQWLGFGVINFFVQNSNDASWIKVHTIRYPNSTGIRPTVSNPSMQLLAANVNATGSSPNVIMKVPCMAGAIEGYEGTPDLYTRFSVLSTGSIGTTQQTFLSIQNNLVYQGSTNQAMIVLDKLSLLNSTVGGTYIASLLKNPAVSGASYTNIATNSVVSYDTSKTGVAYEGVTGAQLIFVACLSYNNNLGQKGMDTIDLSAQQIFLAPGDRLVVALNSLAGGTLTPVGVALSWYEKQ